MICGHCGAPVARPKKYCNAACYHEAGAQANIEGFWDRATSGPGCWAWTRKVMYRGYGIFTIRGRRFFAHRIAWELTNGPIPEGMVVMHLCDNPPCVNPAHLSIGTHRENAADKITKGRQRPGRLAKLTPEAVREIRVKLAAGATRAALGREYSISATTITKIALGRHWKAA